jgi:hypothetical protein
MQVDSTNSEYSFSPFQDEMGFAPAAMDIDPDASVANLDFTGMSTCAELVDNGGFETGSAWDLSAAEINQVIFNSGLRSLQLGNLGGGVNPSGVSSGKSQVLSIPAAAADPQLRLWIYTKSILTASSAPSTAAPSDTFFGPDTDANDTQAVKLLDANGQPLKTLWEYHGANTQQWGLVQYNLHEFSGQNIRLGFFVENDGAGSTTSMFIDDVSLQTCPTIFAPEEYDQLSGMTSQPDACINQVVNSGFEVSNGWGIPYTAYPAGYVDKWPYAEEVYSGSWAMRTGIPAYKEYLNRYSYSDFWQTVYVPNSAASATLTLYNKMVNTGVPYAAESGDEVNLAEGDPHFAPGAVWGEEPLVGDWMYVLIMNPYNGTILRTLQAWDARSNDWKPRSYDLSAYRGQSIRIQIGTFNNGWDGAQSMYVDEVILRVCDGAVPPPPPPPASCPVGYSERLWNNSFENNGGWYIPITAYSAHYATQYKHSGARSMQTGIVNPWHNRYSYSDFGQYTVLPGSPSTALLRFYGYFRSNDGNDKQYLLVLDNWGYWIDTLVWAPGTNTSGWVDVIRDLSYKPYKGWPIRLQFGTYNNGWGGITSMFVDDVTLCTVP